MFRDDLFFIRVTHFRILICMMSGLMHLFQHEMIDGRKSLKMEGDRNVAKLSCLIAIIRFPWHQSKRSAHHGCSSLKTDLTEDIEQWPWDKFVWVVVPWRQV